MTTSDLEMTGTFTESPKSSSASTQFLNPLTAPTRMAGESTNSVSRLAVQSCLEMDQLSAKLALSRVLSSSLLTPLIRRSRRIDWTKDVNVRMQAAKKPWKKPEVQSLNPTLEERDRLFPMSKKQREVTAQG